MILRDLFSQVLDMSLATGIIILLVLAVRFLLRKTPKIFSYLLWAAVLFRLLCPVALESKMSVLGLLQTADEYHNPKIVYYTTETVTVGGEYLGEGGVPLYAPKKISRDVPREPVPVVQIIWLAGTAGMLLYGLAGAMRLKKRLKSAVWQRDNVFLTDCVGTPFVMGIWHPKIYLPRGITEDEKYYVLAHERHHIERHDHVVKILAYLALSIHWFNPLVWVAFYLAEKDMEMSCDEAVMEVLGASVRADYALSLLCYTGYRRIARGTPLSFGESCAKSRVKNLARWKLPSRLSETIAGVLCVLMLLTCVTDPVFATADEMDPWEEDLEQVEELAPEELSDSKTVRGANRAEAQKYMGTWYMEGYYDVTLEVSEIYDPYTDQDAMHLNFSKYAPKLPVTVQYDWGWRAKMTKYGIKLQEDQILIKAGQTCVFVQQRGSKSILEDYPHLKAIGSWVGVDSPNSYAVLTRTANDRLDKTYYLRMRAEEDSYRGYPGIDWEYISSNNWFSNRAGGHDLTVEDGKLKVSSSRRYAEFDLSRNNIKYSAY